MSSDINEIFKGSYRYLNAGRPYSEENFSVSKDFSSQNLIYSAEIMTRVQTGEFMKIIVDYAVNQHFNPIEVSIRRSLGDQFSRELYRPVQKSNHLEYTFDDGDMAKTLKINVPGKYQIGTPAISCSMLFSRSKKYDPTIINSVNILSSENSWEYLKPPRDKSLYFRSNTHQQDEIHINSKVLTGIKYTLFSSDKDEASGNIVTYHLSKHVALPYLVQAGDFRVEIKNLQDLSPKRMEDYL